MQKKKNEYVIKSTFYGKKLNGFKIYYFGNEQPKILRKDGGGFNGGKHILEVLSHKLKNFEFTITGEKRSQIKKVGKKYFVYFTLTDIRLLNNSTFQQDLRTS